MALEFRIVFCQGVVMDGRGRSVPAAMDLTEAWWRGATPRPRSGAVAETVRLWRRSTSREELPTSEVRGSGRVPTPQVRGGGREEQPHVQKVVAARVQEGLKELLHVQGQEQQR